MNSDIVIFIVIAAIWLISAFTQKTKSNQKNSDSLKETGLKSMIQTLRVQMQQQLEQQIPQHKQPQSAQMNASPQIKPESTHTKKTSRITETSTNPSKAQLTQQATPTHHQADHQEGKKMYRSMSLENHLADAIIWSEILAPPIALRNDFSYDTELK
ncbi:MAG: hypothetical protein HQK77_03255 [Desulfobacterales bacterium]|nr:hypothetical protein [Desulfobacterales bacterium]